MSIGFAAISTTLIIKGNTNITENESDFEIYFSDAILDNEVVYEKVISEDKQTITFTSNDLKKKNDTSTLIYEVTNNSSNYDVEVTINCGIKSGESAEYTSITNSLEDNKTVINAKESISGSLTITLDKVSTTEVTEEYICTLEFNAVERTGLGVEKTQFEKDSWETIARNVRIGNTDRYNIGDTKTVTIAEHVNNCSRILASSELDVSCVSSNIAEQNFIVRVANKSECTTETSETACGFVIEFVDVIDKHNFNPPPTNTYGTNKGGWRDSEMRRYISNVIYSSLPSDLQSVIADTKVISSHGSTSGETNFITTDKLYLLSTKEILGTAQYDTVDSETRQLDYYKNYKNTNGIIGTNVSNLESLKKTYHWYLRSAEKGNNVRFITVDFTSGELKFLGSRNVYGISPAFRIT